MEALLRQLCGIQSVMGALVLSRDGHPLVAIMDDERVAIHAAQCAALFTLLDRYTRAVAFGSPSQVVIETPLATLVLTAATDMLLLLETSPDAPLGRIKLTARQAAQVIGKQT